MSLRNTTAKRLCVTNVTGLLFACFVVIFYLTSLLSSLLQKDLFKGGWSLAEIFFNQIIVTLVTQGLPSSLPRRPLCVSSPLILYSSSILLSQDKNQPFPRLWVAPRLSNSQLPSVAGKETLLGNTHSCFVSPLIARVNTHLTLRSFLESLIVTLIFSLRDTQRIY